MAGSATGPGMMPTKGMPQQTLTSGTPTAGIKPALNVKAPGRMFAGGIPDFNERTGMGYLGGTRDFDESANPGPFQNEIGGGPTPASGGKGGGQQAPAQPNVYQQASGGLQQAMGATRREMGFQPSPVRGFGYQASNVSPTTGGYAGDVAAPRTGYAGDVRGTGYTAAQVGAPSMGYAGDVGAITGPYAGDVTSATRPYAGDVTGMGYTAPSIAGNIGQFVNPFEQQVVSGALGDIERQRQMQANQLGSQFAAAKAFGGSRQAIQEAELARSAMEQGASTAAALRQQGFGQALQAAGQQAQMGARASEFGLGQGLQAQLANQAARQRFGEFGAQQDVQTQLANQAARQRFGEFGAQQGMQAALANQAARQRFGEFGAGQDIQAQLANQQAQARAAEFGGSQNIQAQLANQAARQRLGEFGSQQGMQAALANQAARQRFGEFAGGQGIQAQLANQAAQARAQEFGLGQSMQAQLANQAAGLSGSQQRMGAASQLANLANLGFGMGQTVQQQMSQQGAMQQQLQQQIMNAARQQFEGFRNYPAQALGYYAQALGATPTPQTQTTTKQLGLMDYLTAGATIYGMSDRRLKSDIKQVGKLPSGQSVYSWAWNDKASETFGLTGNSMGVMADETNSAYVVTHPSGYETVNYGALLS